MKINLKKDFQVNVLLKILHYTLVHLMDEMRIKNNFTTAKSFDIMC